MARKTDEKRAKLREALTDIAERQIAAEGLSTLRARDLAAQAGCAVGAIYNVFGDLKQIALAVNGRTFHRLGRFVGDAIKDQELTPRETLVALSHAYLHFAAQNPRLWRALFDIELTETDEVPDWYREELGLLFSYIAEPLADVFPTMPPDEVQLMTRALFSSVHGMVLLGLERRISAVPMDQMERMIDLVMTNIAN